MQLKQATRSLSISSSGDNTQTAIQQWEERYSKKAAAYEELKDRFEVQRQRFAEAEKKKVEANADEALRKEEELRKKLKEKNALITKLRRTPSNMSFLSTATSTDPD